MEIQCNNGLKTLLKDGIKVDFGRGLGFDSDDRTVSRRHISFQLHTSKRQDGVRVAFEVTGKNPIWVFNNRSGEIRVYRCSERGEMESGDSFCVSAKKPVWFNLKKIECESRELGFGDELIESLQSSHGLARNEDLELEAGDFSNIDPVKEFGFIVMGHEFDCYPKKIIRDSRTWNWFLEEAGEKSDDDDPGERKQKKSAKRKGKKGDGNDDDDDWTGESEEDAELITKPRKVQKPKYLTRSKDPDKHIKDTRVTKKFQQKDNKQTNETDTEDEDETDETLGGFIVDDVEDEEIDEAEEEEEEFDEDDDEEE